MLVESARMLWRRRIWVVAAILLALAAGVGTFVAVKPGQESKAQVLFIGSIKQPGVKGPTNPFTNLGGSLAVVASVVQVGVTDEKTAQQLYAKGNRATYSVEPNLAENAGPVLLLTVDDKSPEMVQQTLTAVLNEVKTQLRSLQVERGVDPSLFVTSTVLSSSPKPLLVRKAQIQKAVIAAFAALAILIALILLLERRRARRGSGGSITGTGLASPAGSGTTPVRGAEPRNITPPIRPARVRRPTSGAQGASPSDGKISRTPRPGRHESSSSDPPDAARP